MSLFVSEVHVSAMQRLPTQVVPNTHAKPHWLQLSGSDLRSTQPPPGQQASSMPASSSQYWPLWPLEHGGTVVLQAPSVQVPPWHEMLHPPQFSESLPTSAQC